MRRWSGPRRTSRPARGFGGRRYAVAAEAILSPEARAVYETLDERTRRRIDAAILAIERDPDWGAGPRALAPASSRHTGHIVDLSVPTWAIVYRVIDHGAVVWIKLIYRVFVG
jgi:hypothetical protein